MRIGRRNRTVTMRLPGKSRRARAYAAGTPMRVEIATTATATCPVTSSTFARSNSAQASPYQWVVKSSGSHDPNHVVAIESRKTVKISANMATKKTAIMPQTSQPPILEGRSRRLKVDGTADAETSAEEVISPYLPWRHGTLCCASQGPVSYTHLRAHETVLDLVCRLLLE